METNRVRIGIYEGLPAMLDAIKSTAICREVERSHEWMSCRLRKRENGKYSVFHFTESDTQKVNQAMWSIAEGLMQVSIEYSEDRAAVITQIKEKLSSVIFLKYIAVNKLGWSEGKLKKCMESGKNRQKPCSFTESEVQQLVLAVRELAARILNTEYYPDWQK